MTDEKKLPAFKVQYGQVTISVFEDERTKDGKTFTTQSVSVQRAYYDKKEEKVKFTNTLKVDNLPDVVMALEDVYRNYRRKDQPTVEPPKF